LGQSIPTVHELATKFQIMKMYDGMLIIVTLMTEINSQYINWHRYYEVPRHLFARSLQSEVM